MSFWALPIVHHFKEHFLKLYPFHLRIAADRGYEMSLFRMLDAGQSPGAQ
jgi:hypothetical protein